MKTAILMLAALSGTLHAAPKKPAKKPAKPAPKPVEDEIVLEPEPAKPPAPTDDGTPLVGTGTAIDGPVDSPSDKVEHSIGKPERVRRFYFRAGVARVSPLTSSREMELSDIDGPASLAISNGPVAGSGADVSGTTIPAIIIGYRLPFWGDRFSVETILGTPLDVKLTATGSLRDKSLAPMALGAIPTGVQPLGEDIGEAKGVPPVVTLVYRTPMLGPVQPMIGAGVGVLFAYDEKVTNATLTEVSQPKMSISPAAGLALQAALELPVWKRVHVRFDVKYIAGMLARARVEHIVVKTPDLPVFETAEVGTANLSMWVNPLIVQLGIGIDL